MFKILIVCIVINLALIDAKIFDRCTLAKLLKTKYHFPRSQISRWICIVQHESNFNTKAMNKVTMDYGLFQISQKYWCDPALDTPKGGCNTPCTKFRDDNINDDVKCVKTIYKEFKRLKGNGFKAWTTYDAYCKGNTAKYISKCKGI